MKRITYWDLLNRDLSLLKSWRFSVTQQEQELQTLDAEYTAIKATNLDKMPQGSGENYQEEKLLTAIAKRDEKAAELKHNKMRVADMERLLAQLTEEERSIITRMCIEKEPVEKLAEEMGLDVRQMYNRRNAALTHLLQLRHGSVYQP